MIGLERMKAMYAGDCGEVPVAMFFSTEYLCRQSGVPDYRFLYGPPHYRAEAHIEVARRHDIDALYLWTRGKRNDWREDYQLVETQDQPYVRDRLQNRRLALSRDYYAIDFPDKPPYRQPYVQYGESQELINGTPTYSKPKLDIRTKEDVDRLLPLEPAKLVREGGMFEGVGLIADKIGDKVFLEVGCNSSFRFALGVLGLQEGMVFMREEPEVFGYLVDRMMMQELEYLKVMADYGAHGAWITDIWADLVSAADYRRFILPAAVRFVEMSRRLGLKALYCPTGNVAHLLDMFNEIKPDALHLEGYLDISDIRRSIDPDILLYGNVDAVTILEPGPISAIEQESRRQVRECLPNGRFVLALDAEVSRDTPPSHVDAMINAARNS
jgi:uroporphyrinogen-III decarboxylase